jgi:hypothetical protein
MVVKYVKDFDFPSSAGFHGGAKGYAKGGAVKAPTRTQSTMKREMTQSNKLSGNGALPRISNMDVNKQSGGAGKKLMPGYKNGGQVQKYSKGGPPGIPGMPRVGQALTKSEIADSKARGAALDAENARIAKEEARPLNRLRKLAENTSADVKQGFKTNIRKPVLKAVATAGPKIAKNLAKVPKGKALAAVAGLLGAGALSMMEDDAESDIEMDEIPVTETSRTSENAPVTVTRETQSVTAPMNVTKPTRKPKTPMSSLDLVLDYNRKKNPYFDKSMEQQVRDRFDSPSEGGMMHGGKVRKYADGGKAEAKGFLDKPRDFITDDRYPNKKLSIRDLGKGVKEGVTNYKDMINRTGKFEPSPKDGKVRKYADGGSATYGTTMTPLQRSKMKRGSDPYEDRTRGLGVMTDAEAEAASKELREKYGKKKDKPVMHPGGRQRFLLNQNEKTPMKSGGKAESSKSDMKQDRALMSRHNRLMHPDQKSKMKNGGKSVPSYSGKPLIKKSGGGGCNY